MDEIPSSFSDRVARGLAAGDALGLAPMYQAQAFGVRVRRLSEFEHWKETVKPTVRLEKRIARIIEIRAMAYKLFRTKRGVQRWMRNRSQLLDGECPRALLLSGRPVDLGRVANALDVLFIGDDDE